MLRDVVSLFGVALLHARNAIRTRPIGMVIAVAFIVSGSSGCKPAKPSDIADHSSDALSAKPIKTLVEMSPSEVVEYAHRQQRACKWSKLEACLLDHQRRDVTDLVQALDRLEYANNVLSGALIHSFGRAIEAKFDKPSAASMAGVFSAKIQVVSEKIQGEQAAVIFQVADRMPLEQVLLVRCASHWCIETDPPIKGLPKELNLIADVMTDVALVIDVKRLTPEQTFGLLQRRLAPMKRRIARMSKEAEPQSN